MPTLTGDLNPQMLRMARDSRGLAQWELAEVAGVARGTIAMLELGAKSADDAMVRRIAEALRYPPSFFSLEERYLGLGTSVAAFRKQSGTCRKQALRLQAEVNLRRIHAKALLRDAPLQKKHFFPRVDGAELTPAPEDAAAMVRARWNLPAGPIRDLVGAIEAAGGIVFRFPFGTTQIDSIGQWPDGCPPLFFLNAQVPGERARISLAHELGHVVLRHNMSEAIEAEADRFAAALLMPEIDITPQLHDMSFHKALALKPDWRVTMAALMQRACDLGCMSHQDFRRLFTRFTKLGYRQVEPEPIAPEEPELIARLLAAHLSAVDSASGQIAGMRHWYNDELQAKYLKGVVVR